MIINYLIIIQQIMKISKRLWILLPLALFSNDSFWEFLRGVKCIRDNNSYIYLGEIRLSIIYFVLVSYWDDNIRYFSEFKNKFPRIYAVVLFVLRGINFIAIYVMYIVEIIMIAQEKNCQQYTIQERDNAIKRLKEHKQLVVDNSKHGIVIGFAVSVCIIVLWLLCQDEIIGENILRDIAYLCNLFIMTVSVIFITKNYSKDCTI